MKTSDLPTVETEDVRLASALALLADERSATGHKRVAAEYRRVGVFDRAQHHLTEALVLSPRDGAAYDERARTWRDARDLGRALSDAYRAVYFAPASAGAHNTLGTVLYGLGRVPEARRRFETAASLDPAAAYARSNVCFVAYVEGDLVRAKAECEEALRLAPDLDAARQNQELVAAAMDAARP
jgi:Flp pilus assembly protein TadD